VRAGVLSVRYLIALCPCALRRHRLRRTGHRRRPRRLARRRSQPAGARPGSGRARARRLHRLAGGARARRPAPPADGIVTGHTAMAQRGARLPRRPRRRRRRRASRPWSRPDGPTTYGELRALACRTGNALRGLGVELGQRVRCCWPDGVAWAAVFFGALRIGRRRRSAETRGSAPPDWAANARRQRRGACSSPIRRCCPTWRRGSATCPALEHVIVAGGAAATGLEALQAARGPTRCRPRRWTATTWPSGSTRRARPAGRRRPSTGIVTCSRAGITGSTCWARTEEDRTFATSKLFFAYALGNALLIPLFVGAGTFLDPRWAEPDGVARTVTAFRPTLFFSVRRSMARMLRAGLPSDTFRSVRACVSAGERLPVEVYERWRARFGVEILDGLGATETIFMVLSNRPRRQPRRLGGQAGAGHRGAPARRRGRRGVRRHRGRAARPHAVGEPRLLDHPDHTRRTFVDGWFRTGDLLTRDADGFYQSPRPRGRRLQGGRSVGDAGRRRARAARAPAVAEAAVRRRRRVGRPRQAVRVRRGQERRARRAAGGRAGGAGRRAAPAAPAAAAHRAGGRAAAHGHGASSSGSCCAIAWSAHTPRGGTPREGHASDGPARDDRPGPLERRRSRRHRLLPALLSSGFDFGCETLFAALGAGLAGGVPEVRDRRRADRRVGLRSSRPPSATATCSPSAPPSRG